jgi:endoglucanase
MMQAINTYPCEIPFVSFGNEITFAVNSVATGGAGALTYTWHSGTPNAAGAVVANTRAGTVRMGNVTPGNRTFYVVASDARGRSAISRVITVAVPPPPKPTATPRPTATLRPTAPPRATATRRP